MGTRINVMFDHDVTDYQDQAAVLARLAAAAPAALAVHEYWNRAGDTSQSWAEDGWAADPVLRHEREYRSYTGPGGLFLKVGPHAAKIRTAGRWRGFLSIPPLHQVHLRAFRDIARALGATRIAYFPDDDDLYDVFYGAGTFGDGIAVLERDFGASLPDVDNVAAEIAEETEHHVPCVWYVEDAPGRSGAP